MSAIYAIALACPVCWGDAASPLIDGAKAGVGFLMVVIVGVLFGVAMTARKWARRAREIDAEAARAGGAA
jgi:ABC-type nitrate/sulfonate/bicarbonate transport system permease component